MNITLTTGKGEGSTLLSAFDAALMDAGVHNFNLICLSSIIPPNSVLIKEKFNTREEDYGKRLYVVMSSEKSDLKGEFIGGAVGCYQFKDGTGRGVFVEHHFKGKNYDEVFNKLKSDVNNSVKDLLITRGINDFNDEDIQMMESITQVNEKPASVLSIAVYKSEEW